jgi:Xaa-Pro dipeptidase
MDKSIDEALERFPPDEYPSFLDSEFEARIESARKVMRELELDAILVTSEVNFRYLTGDILQTPVQIARPRYFVLPLEGGPCAIVPATNVDGMRKTTWGRDIRSWVAPCPEDDGVTLVADALRAAGGRFGQLGAELGQGARLSMPVLDFLRLSEFAKPSTFLDAEVVFRRIRMVKSPAPDEVDRIRGIARIVSASFEALPAMLGVGDTEWSVCRRMQLDLTLRVAHRTPHLVGVPGLNGYTNINAGPTAKVLEAGSVFNIDAGCCFDNYWCDFNRNFAFDHAIDPVRRTYDTLFKATDAGLAAARPGRTTSDLFAAMWTDLSQDGPAGGTVVGMGHGIDLLAPEPPSVNATDHTILRTGMLITLKPSVSFTVPGTAGPKARMMAHEENLVITDDGYELLTTRTPPELPIIAI